MIALGLGTALGSLFGNHLVKKLGEGKSLLFSLIGLIILYAVLPFSTKLAIAVIIFFVIFLIGGFVFPVFMSIFQSLTTTARGTMSSISSATMYGGTTLGGAIGGLLFGSFPGFMGISFFTVLMYILSLFIYTSSGIFKVRKSVVHDAIEKTQ